MATLLMVEGEAVGSLRAQSARRDGAKALRWDRYEVPERSRSSWYRAAYGAVGSLRGDRAF